MPITQREKKKKERKKKKKETINFGVLIFREAQI